MPYSCTAPRVTLPSYRTRPDKQRPSLNVYQKGKVLPRVSSLAGVSHLQIRGAVLGRNLRPIRANVPRKWTRSFAQPLEVQLSFEIEGNAAYQGTGYCEMATVRTKFKPVKME